MIDVLYWLRGHTHDEMFKMSAASVRRVYPDANISVVSDPADGAEPAMLANIRAQLSYLLGAPDGQVALFLDADTLLRREIPLPGGVHLLVTWRDHVAKNADGSREEGIANLMPYNYGVIAVRACNATREAWMWLYQRVCNMGDRYQDWYGNQIALAELVGARPKQGMGEKAIKIRWAEFGRSAPTYLVVHQAPCELYNYVPEAEGEDVSEKYVLHFKGGRKDMMAAYAEVTE